MSAGSQPLFGRTQDQVVLGELLHSLSQPLTSLRCSLELSVEEVAGQQQDAVSAALEQTDRVIGVVRLMREYLDAESATPPQTPAPVGPVLRSVVDQLSPKAAERQVRLQLSGGCSPTIALPEPRLRLALQYLIGVLIEGQARPRDITLRLEQGPSESELRAHVEQEVSSAIAPGGDPVTATLHIVQLAIARRLLESAGAVLIFGGDNHSGFLLRIPRPTRPTMPELFS
jgi:light-regulated signal transduction histidine kinase (bacteriophytochrome)